MFLRQASQPASSIPLELHPATAYITLNTDAAQLVPLPLLGWISSCDLSCDPNEDLGETTNAESHGESDTLATWNNLMVLTRRFGAASSMKAIVSASLRLNVERALTRNSNNM